MEMKILVEGLIIPPLPMPGNQDLKHKWDLELLKGTLMSSAADEFQPFNQEQGRVYSETSGRVFPDMYWHSFLDSLLREDSKMLQTVFLAHKVALVYSH